MIRDGVDLIKNTLSASIVFRTLRDRFAPDREKAISDPATAFDYFETFRRNAGDLIELENRVVVEIGPGHSVGLALLFLAAGARQVHLVDRFRHLHWGQRDANYYAELLERLSTGAWTHPDRARAALRINGAATVLNPDLLVYHHQDASALPLADGSCDLVFSNAVLEHIPDVAGALSEFRRVSTPEGWNYHQVGVIDHFALAADPLRCLTASERKWKWLFSNRPGYSNRLRMSDFVTLMERGGFSIERKVVNQTLSHDEVERKRPAMKPPWNAYPTEDLASLSFYLALKKRSRA